MRVINFIAGPSAGKSTRAFELAGALKARRLNCELAPEFAKELAWNNDRLALDDQLFVLATQHYRLYRLRGHVDYVVTDAPLLLSLFYMKERFCKYFTDDANRDNLLYAMEDLIFSLEAMYDNLYVYVERGDRAFVQHGRVHGQQQSLDIDRRILDMLDNHRIPYMTLKDGDSIDPVIEAIK